MPDLPDLNDAQRSAVLHGDGPLLVFAGAANVPATWTPPGLMTEQWDRATSGTYRNSSESATQALSSAGATGTRTAILSTSSKSVAIMIAIAPA